MDFNNSIENHPLSQPVILLGASNLTRDFPLILRLLKNSVKMPCDIYAAMGHGRSYGLWSRLLYRALPGITKCEIWDALPKDQSESLQPLAIITDIGNDLIYGQSTDAIFGWVESCIQQLKQVNARITITLLPEASLSQLSPFRFELTRRFFFPKNPATLTDLKQKVQNLNERLAELAKVKQISVVEIPPASYGFDPIHYRYSQRSTLWKSILAEWELPESSNQSTQNHWYDFIYSYYHLKPATKRQWGKLHQNTQPAKTLVDGTRISVY